MLRGDELAPDEAIELEHQALVDEERHEIEQLLARVRHLPRDTKSSRMLETIGDLQKQGYGQILVFTQFTDTLDFLRGVLVGQGIEVMCFSGRGGEVRRGNRWQVVSRDEIKRRFREGGADVLLCTDAAAEGLNFQFCGGLVNYDMPWNPMRVEQRIGRIDRLGQVHDTIRVVNLHYEDTVEADVYMALRARIHLFEQFVGRLQPILARLPRAIADVALSGDNATDRDRLVTQLSRDADRADQAGFDLDATGRPQLAAFRVLIEVGGIRCHPHVIVQPGFEQREAVCIRRPDLGAGRQQIDALQSRRMTGLRRRRAPSTGYKNTSFTPPDTNHRC